MTREEIINILRKEVDNYDYSLFHSDLEQADKEILQKKIDALDKAIKALEQESQTFEWCTDCREYDQEKHCCHRWSKVIRNAVEEMKQPKTGHWISYWDEEARCYVYKCPECGNKQPFDTKCCWECGTRLIEPQESEETDERG